MRLAYHQCRWRGLTSADKVAARARQLGRRDPGAARFAGDLERRGVQILTVTARDVSDEDTFSRWVHAQLVVRAYDLALPIPTLRPGGAVSAP